MSVQFSPAQESKSMQKYTEIKYYYLNEDFILESGNKLTQPRIAYHTFGQLNEAKDNVVWIIHALTGNSNPTEWWSDMVGENCPIDPNKHFIVCANALGSHYGSTCALDINPLTGKQYYHDFPNLTVRDLVGGFIKLRSHLGIDQIHTLVGASIGGHQAMEWAIMESDRIKNLVLIATSAYHSPWAVAFNESQRMAIESDKSWSENTKQSGIEGLKAARAIAMLSYRTYEGFNLSQSEESSKVDHFKASSYQRYQGLKLANRYNAYSYYLFTKIGDSHDVGRGRASRESALSQIKAKTVIIGITSDILYPLEDQRYLNQHIKNSVLYEIESKYGHDGFLVEKESVNIILSQTI
jgi:homoserine O-acetyltransferase/O-succinyltransferase